MFRGHNLLYARILFAADLLSGLVALTVAYSARSLVRYFPQELSLHFNPELLPLQHYVYFFLVCLPVWAGLLLLVQGYSEILQLSPHVQLVRAAQSVALVGLLLAFLVYTLKLEVSRPIFFVFLILNWGFLVGNRVVLGGILRTRNIGEHNQINILVVGAPLRITELVSGLERSRRWGFHVVGHLTKDPQEEGGPKCLGALSDLPRLLREGLVVDEIIFAGSDISDLAGLQSTISLCQELGIRTRVAADFFPANSGRVVLEYLDGLPLISLLTVPEHNESVVIKRILDFVVAASGLIVFGPLMLLIAIAVRTTSSGPVFYRQTRCGLFGRRFTLIKFRTMVHGAQDRLWEVRHLNEMSGPVFKMRNDPRVTPLGRFLRKSSLDELPQFWNVIKGQMSVVGPRAPLPEEVEHYSLRQRRRLSVKPGVTCLWQVSGRNEIDFQKWMDLDLQYIDNWSLWLDLSIMLRTIPAVFSGRGAR